MMRIENWQGYDIRFVEINGEWYGILKDICDALSLRTNDVAQRLDPDMLERVTVEEEQARPRKYKKNSRNPSKVVSNSYTDSNGVSKVVRTRQMLAVNEIGIYEALYASRKLEARKFRRWSGEVMKKLRSKVGLEQYEVMKMTDPEVQADIDWILDSIYYDESTGKLMRSITVQGGDVEQVEFN